MNALTLKARLRNAKAERKHIPTHSDIGVRCLFWLREYREAGERFAETRGFSDWSHLNDDASYDMEYAAKAFAEDRAKLRANARFARAMEAA